MKKNIKKLGVTMALFTALAIIPEQVSAQTDTLPPAGKVIPDTCAAVKVSVFTATSNWQDPEPGDKMNVRHFEILNSSELKSEFNKDEYTEDIYFSENSAYFTLKYPKIEEYDEGHSRVFKTANILTMNGNCESAEEYIINMKR